MASDAQKKPTQAHFQNLLKDEKKWLGYLYALTKDYEKSYECFKEAALRSLTLSPGEPSAREVNKTLFHLCRRTAHAKISGANVGKKDESKRPSIKEGDLPSRVKAFWREAPPGDRELLHLAVVEKLSLAEIKAVLGRGTGVESQLEYIFSRLCENELKELASPSSAGDKTIELAVDPRNNTVEMIFSGKAEASLTFNNATHRAIYHIFQSVGRVMQETLVIQETLRLPRDIRNKLVAELTKLLMANKDDKLHKIDRYTLATVLALNAPIFLWIIHKDRSLIPSIPATMATYKILTCLALSSLGWFLGQTHKLSPIAKYSLAGIAGLLVFQTSSAAADDVALIYTAFFAAALAGSCKLFLTILAKERTAQLREKRLALQIAAMAGDFYDAFISYRHRELDSAVSDKLHELLTQFETPENMVNEGFSPRFKAIFKDTQELAASADLSSELTSALNKSEFLIVVCSPDTPHSDWVCREITAFKEMGKQNRILAVLVAGEPAESFPAPLLEQVEEGVARKVEPLAVDVRALDSETVLAHLQKEYLRIVATMMGFPYGRLTRSGSKTTSIKAQFSERSLPIGQRKKITPIHRRIIFAGSILAVALCGIGFKKGLFDAQITLQSTPRHIVLNIDGAPYEEGRMEETPIRFKLRPGKHTLTLINEMFQTREVTMSAKLLKNMALNPEPLNPKTALVQFVGDESATVTFKGNNKELKPPFKIQLPVTKKFFLHITPRGGAGKLICAMQLGDGPVEGIWRTVSSTASTINVELTVGRGLYGSSYCESLSL